MDSMIAHFEKNKKYLKSPLTHEQINDISYYCEKGWYLQILKEFGIVIALLILEYFEKEEEYLVCREISNSIENSNKHFGTTYPLSLEEYGNMP